MAAFPAKALPHRMTEAGLAFLQALFRDCEPRDFAVRLWDGTTWSPEPGRGPAFVLAVHRPDALRRMFWPPTELALGEAYVRGDFDVEGDFESAFALADHLTAFRPRLTERLALARLLLALPPPGRAPSGDRAAPKLEGRLHSPERDRLAVTSHYDVSNAFYALWLDGRMVYSTGCFEAPDDDLETAQERKLDIVCRKLRLAPGERFLDIGCGWGGLILHAASRYGVRAVGITLSRPQADFANARIRAAGLSDRCRAEVRDYREMEEPGGFDKLASVGMFEHVGAARLPEYFGRAWRLLRPGGVFLNHAIASSLAVPPRRGPSFVDRHVFPDGELLPVSATLAAAESVGFEVRDAESLREHYVLTLRHWAARLAANRDRARLAAGETVYRTWRLYLTGSAYGFRIGRTSVFQALLCKPDGGRSGLPLTRADWYATP
ncbi:MAG: class I SAM-dependent methyltransferase [Gemmatimonadota bacterium]